MAKVSILSAIYNEEKHLAEMIESVLGQSHDDFELMLVDDGSTDQTVAIAHRFATLDPRVILVSEGRKLGKVAAFNLAFEKSSGDVVILLGGDDILPESSLSHRAEKLGEIGDPASEMIAASFRLKSFSDNPKFDGMVIPRRNKGNWSGGTLAISRPLAEKIFPIDESLVAEDIWIGSLIGVLAQRTIVSPQIVLNYRIHESNSNPRQQSFAVMTDSMHNRMRPHLLIPASNRFELTVDEAEAFAVAWELEELRFANEGLKILLRRGAPAVSRLRNFATSGPRAYALRTRLYRLFSGW